MAKIAFFGLGNMGGPMAANLVRAGHSVAGSDPSAVARTAASLAGVSIAATANDAMQGAEIVITMLPSGRHVLALYNDLLPLAAAGTLFIDSSTIEITDARAAHTAASTAGMRAIDAPVSGGTGGATAGTLTFMCGGADADFAAAHLVLAQMGRNIFHSGAAGAGQAAKICNNLILGISMIAVSEAFVLAEKLGLAADQMFKVAAVSSGQCWSLTTYCPEPGLVPTSPANRDYQGGFAAALMLKDLHLAMAAAKSSGAAGGLGPLATDIYQRFCDEGGAGRDFSAIITALRAASTSP